MTVHEGKEFTSLVQCCAMERFHSGKVSMIVQRETTSEQYVCFTQGQEKHPAQLVAMQWKHVVKVNNKIAVPRPGYSPRPAYGTTLYGSNLQRKIPGASAKARLVARPGLWCCTVGKQPARKHSICLSYVHWIASPYLVAYVVAAPWHSNQQMCLQRKKVQGVLTSAVRSATKRLALHCIAAPILPMQRVFPHTANQKQGRKMHSSLYQGQAMRLSARCPAQRPATDWGRHTAAPNALKTGHFKQTFTDFNILPTRYDTKNALAPLPRPGNMMWSGCTLQPLAGGPKINYNKMMIKRQAYNE